MRRALLALSLMAATAFGSSSSFASSADQQSQADVEKIVKEYIQKNPEIVVNAIQEWQR